MLTLSGLRPIHSDLVLTISYTWLFPLMSMTEGPFVTAVKGLWPGLPSCLGLSKPLWLMVGLVPLACTIWGLISCCIGGLFPLFFPSVEVYRLFLVWPLVCGYTLVAWLVSLPQLVMSAHPLFDPLSLLFDCTGIAQLIYLLCIYVLYFL